MKKISVNWSVALFLPSITALAGIRNTVFFIISVVIHELGHICAIKLFRLRICAVRVNACGLDIKKVGKSSYTTDIIISLAGPLAGVLLSLISLVFGIYELTAISFFASAFNMLPIRPLDGGCILEYLLKKSIDFRRADNILRGVEYVVFFVVFVCGILVLLYTGWNASLIFISLAFILVFFQKKI